MKWKILIKLLYLIVLLAIAALERKEESRLIDSDPSAKESVYQVALTD